MNSTPSQLSDTWQLHSTMRPRMLLIAIIAVLLLAWSAKRSELDKGVVKAIEGVGDAVGIVKESDVGKGWNHFFNAAFPLVLAERTEVQRIADFDRANLPWGASIATEAVREYDVEKNTWIDSGTREILIEPVGYLWRVCVLMVRTIEIGIWGTLLAIVFALPLSVLGARGYSPNKLIYTLARAACSLSRAIPELISAMFFVLMFGFGPVPGVLALGVHSFGFLGKFFADDIENAPPGPPEALRSTGANRLKVLRYAVLPQVLPQYAAYVQYILERNVRSATVLGIVGAGGIGMELKGRWDLSDFGHVTTILLVIFATVLILEHLTQQVRRKLI